jgi:hypothetical protein
MPPRPPTIFAIIASSILFYSIAAVPSLATGDPKAGRKKALECHDGLAAKAHFRRVSIEPRLHDLKDGFVLALSK